MKTSLILALAVFVILLPLLAAHPPTGDSYEQVTMAISGGVLHPPGFPLQAWINRLIVAISPLSAARSLSLISALAHASTVFVISETLRILCGSSREAVIARCIGACAFAFFSSTWPLGTHPEVFALAFLLIAIFCFEVLFFARQDNPFTKTQAFLLGASVGLGAAQHPITITAAPAFLYAALLVLKSPKTRTKNFAALAGGFALISLTFFLSLPALKGQSVWPNWGNIHSLSDILNHALRSEYGTFNLASRSGDISSLSLFFELAIKEWNVLLLAAVAGVLGVTGIKNKKLRLAFLVGVGGTCLTAGIFLSTASLPSGDGIAGSELVRFHGTLAVPVSLLIGFGIWLLEERATQKALRWAIQGAAAVVISALVVLNFPIANFAQDNTTDVFRKIIEGAIAPDDLYIISSDVEPFFALPRNSWTKSERRYGIVADLLPRPWYISQVVPMMDSRVHFLQPGDGTLSEIVNEAFQDGLKVAAVDGTKLQGPGRTFQLRGPVYVVQQGINDELSVETVKAAIKMCEPLAGFVAPPEKGHIYSHALMKVWARGFDGAARYLDSRGMSEAGQHAHAIVHGLLEGQPAAKWMDHCTLLKAKATAAGF
jgi:hypothetical protein